MCRMNYLGTWRTTSRAMPLDKKNKMSRNVRKRTVWHMRPCRLKSSWASAQSDQSLRSPHDGHLHPWLFKMHQMKILITARIHRRMWIFAGGTCPKVRFLTLQFMGRHPGKTKITELGGGGLNGMKWQNILGSFVQSIVSLTSSFVVSILTVLLRTIANSQFLCCCFFFFFFFFFFFLFLFLLKTSE